MKLVIFVLLSLAYCGSIRAQSPFNFEKGLTAIQAIKNDTLRIDSMYYYGRDMTNDHVPESIEVGKVLLKDAELHHYKRGIANGNYLLGLGYQYLPNYALSLKYYLEALRLQKELNLISFQIGTCIDIANVYEMTGDLGLQKKFILEAKGIYEDNRNVTGLKKKSLMVLNNLGTILKKEGKYDSSIALYKEVISGALADGNNLLAVAGLVNVAIVYKTTRQFDTSLAMYNRALTLVDSNSKSYLDLMHLSSLYSNMANLYYEMGNDERAEYFGLKSLKLEKSVDIIDIRREAYEVLKKIYLREKRYPDAIQYYNKWVAVKDTILNREKSEQIKEMQTRYDTEIKDKQIITQEGQLANNRKINLFLVLISLLLLAMGVLAFVSQRQTARLNRELSLRKKEVEQLNEVKDRIFSVISHDMRTPVNSLMAFTQILESGNVSAEKMSRYAATLNNTLGYTAGLMENLLNWARTQMQGYKPVLETFEIGEVIRETVSLLRQDAEKKNIEIAVQIEGASIAFTDINMSALLIRNLASNAIKYTPRGGTINISTFTSKSALVIKIKDTGVGISRDLVAAFNQSTSAQPLDSTPGTNQEKGTGLGLMLCKNFAALMNGRITLESEPGKGSCFTVELPVA